MQAQESNIKEISIDRITVVSNPRNDYGDIDGLAPDIAERGLLDPLILNEQHELVDGHRRLTALKQNNATTAACLVAPGQRPLGAIRV